MFSGLDGANMQYRDGRWFDTKGRPRGLPTWWLLQSAEEAGHECPVDKLGLCPQGACTPLPEHSTQRGTRYLTTLGPRVGMAFPA